MVQPVQLLREHLAHELQQFQVTTSCSQLEHARGGEAIGEGALAQVVDEQEAGAGERGAVLGDYGAHRLGHALDLVGEEEEATQMYEMVCESQPAPINALINLAVLYEDRGDYVRAERSLRQVLDTSPNHPRARLYMKDVQASRDMFVEEEQTRDVLKRNALLYNVSCGAGQHKVHRDRIAI